MIEKILVVLSGFVISAISALGYTGIALLMAIESACIPLPSEVIMPFSGYLVFKGEMNLWGVAVAGAVGCVLGSWVAYYVGYHGGRPLVMKYGRYMLISHRDIALADRMFERYGDMIIFVGRLLPVIRTFIALPAGISRMPLWRFTVYTFIGSLIWCYALAWIGLKLGENWQSLKAYFHGIDIVIGVALVAGLVWYVWRHIKYRAEYRDEI